MRGSGSWFKAVNSETGDLLDIWVRFVEDEGGVDKEWDVKTGSDGIAELDWDYDANPEIHVISVMVVEGQDLANCTLAVQPVTLTVGTETCLWLWIERDHTGTGHTIYGRLEQDSLGIPGETIELGVNGTVYTLTTNGTGHISLPIELQPVDEQATTYQITATFNGTNPQTLNATTKNPYGTEYPVCTTTQYDLRPASNSITLIVGPQSTDAFAPTKTPEQMEQEAKDSEWFWGEPRFSWSYPWFRLHFVLSVDLPQGNPNIDYGWSFLPFGESYSANHDVIAGIINEFGSLGFRADVLMAPFVTIIIQYIAARMAGMTALGVLLAIAIYTSVSILQTLALYFLTGQDSKSWLGAFLTSAISCTMGLVLTATGVLKWLTSAARLLFGQISSVIKSMNALKLNFLDVTGIAFAFIDFALMIVYLRLYLASIG